MATIMGTALLKKKATFWPKLTQTLFKTSSLHRRLSVSRRKFCLGSYVVRGRELLEMHGNRRMLKPRNAINTIVVENIIKLSACMQYKSSTATLCSTSALFAHLHRKIHSSSSGNRNISSPGQKAKTDNSSSENSSPSSKQIPETFDNYQIAYGRKSIFELLRVLCFFTLCKFSFFTDNALKVMGVCYRILGWRLAEALIKKAAYDQFVAGETADDVNRVAHQLRQGGVASILCVPIETDDRVSAGKSKETFLDANLDKVLASIHLCTQLGDPLAMSQFRISALLASDLTKVINRFCDKTTHNLEVIGGIMDSMFERDINFSELPGWEEFPQDRSEELRKGLQRLGKIIHALENREVIALIDAEYTSINPALRLLSLCLMKACNTEHAKIFYTYQAYLKATRANLERDLTFAATNGFSFGLKLVRGAYMIPERQLARDMGYPDPVNDTFEQTSASYHSCLDLLLERVAVQRPGSVRFMIASHNEDTVRYAMGRMHQLRIPKDGPDVFFGQLYGMADHVSFTLGSQGYRVYKSIPYGPVQETLPYLARRAQENKAILANARRERQLVAKALLDRLRFKT